MDNLITSIIGAVIFIAFVAGLAHSIGAVPFIVIVGIVIALLLFDIFQSAREEFSAKRSVKD